VDVDIQEADYFALHREPDGQVNGDSAFADTTFAA
jgi:hypothetical protein